MQDEVYFFIKYKPKLLLLDSEDMKLLSRIAMKKSLNDAH